MTLARYAFLAAAVGGAFAPTAVAAVPPPSTMADKSFRDPRLDLGPHLEPVAAPAGLTVHLAFADPRASGRPTSLVLSEPLLPGSGVGNELQWSDLGGQPLDESAMKDAAWRAVTAYLARQGRVLAVDLAELSPPRVGIFEGGALI